MRLDPEDIAICVNDDGPADEHGAVPMSTPVVLTSLFGQASWEMLLEGFTAEQERHVYSRGQNPTVEALERKLARLERGEACKCVGSGMGAVSAVLLATVKTGDHVVFVNQTYGPTLQLARHLRRFNVEHSVVLDGTAEDVAAAITSQTRIIWLENPGTMLMRLIDVAGIAALARSRGILTCIDNSWATPLLQKPIEAGIDLVVHSATKYLAGHSDVIAGAVVGSAERVHEIFHRSYMLNGAVLSPFDAWLVLRGLRTLPVRLAQHETDALRVAEFLQSHPAVRRVFHPAFEGSPWRDALRGYSGLLSFELRDGTFDAVSRVLDAFRVFRIGVSWGGVESIAVSPNRKVNVDWLQSQQIPPGLVRISVGLEGADALIADLTNALGH